MRQAGLHSERMDGISGSPAEGADAIVLSGGYPDDIFSDDTLIYTGHGKRDPETDKITENQELNGANLAMAYSSDQGLPIRVIRAINPIKKALPAGGYKYEGIYFVEHYDRPLGIDGHRIWKFHLRKDSTVQARDYEGPKRSPVTTQRIIRNTLLAQEVKGMYKHKCQICGIRIETFTGFYAEGAHIRPLGAPHNGEDGLENILCLCPNHHTMLDFGTIYITKEHKVIVRSSQVDLGKITINPRHTLSEENLIYQRSIYEK